MLTYKEYPEGYLSMNLLAGYSIMEKLDTLIKIIILFPFSEISIYSVNKMKGLL